MSSHSLSRVAALLIAVLLSPLAIGQQALWRVNGAGYATDATQRAYLMSMSALAGTGLWRHQLTPIDARTPLELGADAGPWGSYAHVYAIDVDAREPGTYRLELGTGGAASPVFAVGTARALYTPMLARTLAFYHAERDGDGQRGLTDLPFGPQTGHLNDRHALVYLTPTTGPSGEFAGNLSPTGAAVDASGGWWDAGDYLKFVQTTSYVTSVLALGARDFPEQMGAGGAADFLTESRYGTEWLLQMWDEPTATLYYQVGIGAGNPQTLSDHDLWRLPGADDDYGGCTSLYRYICHRPVFINPTGAGGAISPNLAGRLTAAFALGYQNWHASDPVFAARCLAAAEHIFAHADTAPPKLLTTVPYGFYPETAWQDDMELGATELALASAEAAHRTTTLHDAAYYTREAARWAAAYIHSPFDGADSLNLYDVSALAHVELIRWLRLTGQSAGAGLAVDGRTLRADLLQQLARAETQATSDPFGFGFGWAQADTAAHGFGLVVTALAAQWLGGADAGAPADRWLANLLGANAWGTSLVIGTGSVFPDCPQHQVANLLGSLDGASPVLAGAVVEGPAAAASRGRLDGMRTCPPGGGDADAPFNGNGAVFRDNVQSYTTVEPAIDLTVLSPLAIAWRVAGAPRAMSLE